MNTKNLSAKNRVKQRVAELVQPACHDSAWKDILDAYFPEFMAFFYPRLTEVIDWSIAHEILDKELQAITTAAMIGRRCVDKLLRVQLRQGGERLLLIHIEIQATPEAEFGRRLFEYYYRLYDRYNQPTITLAVLADSKPHWRPQPYQAKVMDIEILTFRFLTTKLLDYRPQTEALEKTANPFGIVVQAHLAALATQQDPEQRFTYKFSLTRQLYERGLGRDDVLNLYKFIDWVMKLPEPLEIRYNEAIYQLEEQRAMSYVTSAERIGMKKGFEQGLLQGIEQGLEQGIGQGVEQGKREGEYALVLRLLQCKFGPLPKAYRQRLAQADADTLLLWGERVLAATSLEHVFEPVE